MDPVEADRAAIARVLEGDADAYAEIVQRHETSLRRIVTGLVGDAHVAEDVVQEVFLAAYRALPSFRGEAPFGAWLYRIAVREAGRSRSQWRRLWRWLAPIEKVEEAARTEHAATVEDASEDLERVLDTLLKLPERERAALVLHAVEELSYEEIGRALQCTSGTVGSLIHRARKRLKELAESEGVREKAHDRRESPSQRIRG